MGQPMHPVRNQYGMMGHVSGPQLQTMSEAEKARFLEEENKRTRRNQKIAQLVSASVSSNAVPRRGANL